MEATLFFLVLPTFTLTSVLSCQGRGVLISGDVPESCLTFAAGPAILERKSANPKREIPNDFKTPNTNTDTRNAYDLESEGLDLFRVQESGFTT
jgi:hypothetical protein